MSHSLRIAACSLCVLLTGLGCSTLKVDTDYNPEARFAGRSTYAFAPRAAPGEDIDTLDDTRVRGALVRELDALGFTEAEAGAADVWVAWHTAVDSKIDVQSGLHISSLRHSGPLAYGLGSNNVREIDVGSLMIDFIDPGERQVIWRGTAEARIRKRDDPKDRKERIGRAVAGILDEYPPERE